MFISYLESWPKGQSKLPYFLTSIIQLPSSSPLSCKGCCEIRKDRKDPFLFLCVYSRSKRASFLSIQIVAKGKKAAIKAKTLSSSSQANIFLTAGRNRRYRVKNKPWMLPIVLMYTIGKRSVGLVRIQIIAVKRKNQETASARQMFLNHRITFSCGYFENNFSRKFINYL